MSLVPTVKLNNGLEMPAFGLGTYEYDCKDQGEVIKHAIDCGYRYIDTAMLYQNEAQIGKAIQEKIDDGTVKREDIFLVTKFWSVYHEKVEYACRLSLKRLGLDYIDLYLMHSPMGCPYVSDKIEDFLPMDTDGNIRFSDVDYLDTWRDMEKLVELGLVKSVGVSNFNSEQVQRLLENCTIKPVTNQVECGPSINQKELINFCTERGVTITAYSPLGRPHANAKNVLQDEKVISIGDKYGKTSAQVILRYFVQLGTIPIPKSANKSRVEENLNVFDFELSDEDMDTMDSFNTGERTLPFDESKNHKYFPFNISF